MSEPGAGSDVVGMKTQAVKKGDRFRLGYTVLLHETADQDFDPAAFARSLVP